MKGRNILIGIVLLTSILFTTYVYAAFSTQLNIEGEAIIRSDQDIRITDIRIQSQTNGAYETYNNKYNKDTTFMYVTLPANSSITYEVDITDNSSNSYDISSIHQLSNTNTSINITISLEVEDIVNSNSTKTFTINILNNTTEEQQETLVYKYGFVEHINPYIVAEYSIPNSYDIVIPYTGKYKIELWGAEGGGRSTDYIGGKGAYVSGEIVLSKDKSIYAFVGEYPEYTSSSCYSTNPNSSFNGSQIGACSGGGGATDIRLNKTSNWYDNSSLTSRIMVAAGGGGAIYPTGSGGDGGEIKGNDGTGISRATNNSYFPGKGASQTEYWFGQGMHSSTTNGGSGYYGGSNGFGGNAGGGSSFISGYKGCIAVTSQNDSTPICTEESSLTDESCSYHYSGYKFTEMQMIGGDKEMTSPTGTIEIGHSGDGYVRITFIKRIFE